MIDFTYERDGETTIVPLSGELDYASRKYFVQCMRDLIDSGEKNLIINLGRVPAVGSVVIAALIGIRKYAVKSGGTVKLINVNSIVADALAVAGLSDYFSLYA